MITSMMGRMADAEKLSIPQLQQAIKNGTIPAYVGVPMLQDKVKQAQQAKQPQPMPPQPPVAQQVMAEADGITAVPSNLPTSYNDGGIVAFAEGGMDDDYNAEDYEDQVAESEYSSALQGMSDTQEEMMQHQLNMQRANSNLRNAAKDIHSTPNAEGGIKAPAGDFYKNMYATLRSKAEEMGFKNPDAIARVGAAQSALETGYGKHLAGGNNYFGIKGSGGNKQTTKEYAPGRGYYTANESFRTYGNMDDSAADFLRLMQNPRYARVAQAETPEEAILHQSRSGYATSPNYGSSLRSIHQSNMAEGGIARLNNVPRFGGGAFIRGIAEETKPFFDIVKSKENLTNWWNRSPTPDQSETGSSVPLTTADPEQDAINAEIRRQAEYERNLPTDQTAPSRSNSVFSNPITKIWPKAGEKAGGVLDWLERRHTELLPKNLPLLPSSVKPPVPSAAPTTPVAPAASTTSGTDNGMFTFPEGVSMASPAPKTPPTNDKGNVSEAGSSGENGRTTGIGALTPRRSAFDDFADEYKLSRAELKKQKEEDKYMALISAGLGMMSGTSPNALANIGQGAMQGVAYHGQANKQRAAERAAMDKAMMSAQRYKSMEEIALANQGLRERMHGDTLGIKERELSITEQLKTDDLFRKDTADLATQLKNVLTINETINKNWGPAERATDKNGWAAAQQKMKENQQRAEALERELNNRLRLKNPSLYSDQPAPSSSSTGTTIKYDSSGAKIK